MQQPWWIALIFVALLVALLVVPTVRPGGTAHGLDLLKLPYEQALQHLQAQAQAQPFVQQLLR